MASIARPAALAASRSGPIDINRHALCKTFHIASGATRTFGQNLREARHAAGLAQADLAHGANLERSTISLYERGLREPNLRTVLKLTRVLKIDASGLVRGL